MFEISVGDVWQLAAEISTQFEVLTDEIGISKLQGILTPTVKALELLEMLAREQSRLVDAAGNSHSDDDQSADDKTGRDRNLPISSEDKERFVENAISGANHQSELSKQHQMMLSIEQTVTELSADLRMKAHIRQRFLNCLESTVRDLEKDCDTLESETGRLLQMNADLRATMQSGNCAITDEFIAQIGNDDSFATELTRLQGTVDRPPPEGEEVKSDVKQVEVTHDPLGVSAFIQNEHDRPRYTLSELQEVLSEKNKFKGRCIVLEDKLREITGDDTITWQGGSITDHGTVETSGRMRLQNRENILPLSDKKNTSSERGIRKLMMRFFQRPTDTTDVKLV